MKKTILLLMAVSLLFVSCSKSEATTAVQNAVNEVSNAVSQTEVASVIKDAVDAVVEVVDLKTPTFEMYQPVDDFGDPKGAKIIRSKTLRGTYTTSAVQDGNMSYSIDILGDGIVRIRIVEDGNSGNLMGAGSTSDTFDVNIRTDSGDKIWALGSLGIGTDKKYNIIWFEGIKDYRLGGKYIGLALAGSESTQIVIKNNRATYKLGPIDTSEVEGLFYNKALNDEIEEALANENFEAVIELVENEGETDMSKYYGFESKRTQALNGLIDKLLSDEKYEEVIRLVKEEGITITDTLRSKRTQALNGLIDKLLSDEKYEEVIRLVKEEEITITDALRSKLIQANIWLIGEVGPAGGWIFYDCDSDNDSGNADGLVSTECGWRYLEAAPENLSKKYSWGPKEMIGMVSEYGVSEVGIGKSNTEKIAKAAKDDRNAAQACLDYSVNGYDDWFLPSIDELRLMYKNLDKQLRYELFRDDSYWSSSETGNGRNAYAFYGGGGFSGASCYNEYKVRPVRAF